MGKIILVLVNFLLVSSQAISDPLFCKDIFNKNLTEISSAAPLVKDNLNKFEAVFTRARGLDSYRSALGHPFSHSLLEIKSRGGHWLDAGAGDAVAVSQFLREASDVSVKATVISLESQAQSNSQLKVLKGRFIEEIPNQEIMMSDLITDVFGPLAYSGHPHLILRKYFESLKSDGQILIFLGARDEIYGKTNRIVTQDGRFVSLVEWIQQLPGIKSEIMVDKKDDDGFIYEKWSLRLTRDSSVPLDIPAVELKDFKPGAPPKMLFQEKRNEVDESNQSRMKHVQEQIQQTVKSNIEKITFTNFMDAFRGGELTHPLVSSIKNLASNESWVNVSEFGQSLTQDLREKKFDASGTNVFWGLSQKWIRLRVNSIDPDRFSYTNVKSSESIEQLKQVGLITDFYGDFLSSLQPDVILNRYLNTLSKSGSVFIYLGGEHTGFGTVSEVLTKSGQRLTIRNWLKSIPGLKYNLHRGGYAYTGGEWQFVRLTKKQDQVQVPKLRFLGAEIQKEGEIPKMIFQEE